MARKGIVDALYWKLHKTYLLNDRPLAERLLAMFLDEAKETKVENELGPIHAKRFGAIREGIESGAYGRIGMAGYCTPATYSEFQPEQDPKERDFHLQLMAPEGRLVLFGCLGIGTQDQKATMVHEYEMGVYGRCDFLIREGRRWHLVEVKVCEADTGIPSQVDKYILSASLDMCMGMHDEVFAAVVARGFHPYAATELSRMGVTMIAHQGSVAGGLRRIVP